MIKTELYINGLSLDLSEDIPFPVTYAIADAKRPESRKRTSTKTIVLPGTRKNSKFFATTYNMHLKDLETGTGFDFDPTLRYPALVYDEGGEIFRGSAHLTQVEVRDGQRAFHVILYSKLADLFQSLGDILVSELGWSAYDHTLSVANIQASWGTTPGSGYVYPLIDFGFTNDLTKYKTNQLYPYVFMKEIFQKCFAIGGFTIESDWLDEADISKIIWGYGGGSQLDLSASEANNRRALYTGNGTQSYSVFPDVFGGTNNNYDAIFSSNISDEFYTITLSQDILGQFDEATGILTVSNNGFYTLRLQGNFIIDYNFDGGPHSLEQFRLTNTMEIYRNGARIATEVGLISASADGSANFTFDFTHEMELDASDLIQVKYKISTFATQNNGPGGTKLNIDVDFNNTFNYDFQAVNKGIIDGDTVNVFRYIPKMKAKDFLKDMITLYNLYLGDPDQDNVIRVEPALGYYYGTDDYDDWSELMARGKNDPITIMPSTNIEGKTYEFHWAEDRDYYKQLYFDVYGIDYGDYDYNVPSTWKDGSKKYHLKTAQSIPVQIEGTDIIIPRIVKLNDATLVTGPHKGKPRMFFWNGSQPATSNWILVNSDTGAETTITTVPQAHHLNDVASPTFDLNFGTPSWLYYTATAYTTANCFTEYHSRFIREITGKDSKFMTAYFNIQSKDLYDEFMRRLKNIDGVLYRVNKVIDYMPNNNQLTKVELIKVVDAYSAPSYSVTMPIDGMGFEPDLFPVINSGIEPITQDTTIRSSQGTLPVDTSAGDVIITLDADTLRKGWVGEFPKMSEAGTLYIQPTGGSQPNFATINGSTDPLIVENQFDAPLIRFDGTNFLLK